MNLFEKPIADNIPFAIIKYSEWLITGKDNAGIAYELIKVKTINEKPFYMDGVLVCNSKNVIEGRILTERQIKYFKNIQHKFKKAISNSYGTVWEFNNFKDHVIKQKVEL